MEKLQPLTLKKATPLFEQLPSKDWDPLKLGRRFTPLSPSPHPPTPQQREGGSADYGHQY